MALGTFNENPCAKTVLDLQDHLQDLQDHLQDLQDHLQDLQKPTRKPQESYKKLQKNYKITEFRKIQEIRTDPYEIPREIDRRDLLYRFPGVWDLSLFIFLQFSSFV